MMQKMLWISTPFLIYYFNYLTFYRPPLVDFFFLVRFQFSVSCWKLFIIIISKIQNLLAVFIKFIYRVQPLENDKEGALVRVPKCFMQNYLSIRMIKSSLEYLEPIRCLKIFLKFLPMLWLEAGTGWLGGCCTFVRMILWAVEKKEMAIYHDGEEIATSFAWTTRKPISSCVRGQAGAEQRRDYEPRLGVRRLEGWWTSPDPAPASLGVFR